MTDGNRDRRACAGFANERMTRRAQAYLLICAVRHLAVGLACVVIPEAFSSPVYSGIKKALPLSADYAMSLWGVLFLVTGVWCCTAAMVRFEQPARIALLLSVITSAFWAGGFAFAALGGDMSVPSSPVLWVSVTLYDLTMLRQPLRNPFESITRRILDDDRRATRKAEGGAD